MADRAQARQERDWPRADQIRAELDALGVQLLRPTPPKAPSGTSASELHRQNGPNARIRKLAPQDHAGNQWV